MGCEDNDVRLLQDEVESLKTSLDQKDFELIETKAVFYSSHLALKSAIQNSDIHESMLEFFNSSDYWENLYNGFGIPEVPVILPPPPVPCKDVCENKRKNAVRKCGDDIECLQKAHIAEFGCNYFCLKPELERILTNRNK